MNHNSRTSNELTGFIPSNVCRFDPEVAVEKLRGKRLVFAGDSLQRSQWESFVCMIEWTIPPQKKSMKRGKIRNVFRAKVLTPLTFERFDHIYLFFNWLKISLMSLYSLNILNLILVFFYF